MFIVSDLDRSAIERSIELDNGPFGTGKINGVCFGSITEIKSTIRISIATLADNYCFS